MRVANQVDETLLSRWSRVDGRPRRGSGCSSLVSHPDFSGRARPPRSADRAASSAAISSSCTFASATTSQRGVAGTRSAVVANLGGEFHVIDADDAGRRRPRVRLPAVRHAGRPGGAAPIPMEGARARVVRHAADRSGRRTSTSTSSRVSSAEPRRCRGTRRRSERVPRRSDTVDASPGPTREHPPGRSDDNVSASARTRRSAATDSASSTTRSLRRAGADRSTLTTRSAAPARASSAIGAAGRRSRAPSTTTVRGRSRITSTEPPPPGRRLSSRTLTRSCPRNPSVGPSVCSSISARPAPSRARAPRRSGAPGTRQPRPRCAGRARWPMRSAGRPGCRRR